MPRYLSWLALAVPAGFLVVASVEVRLHTRVPARDGTGVPDAIGNGCRA
jgi:hypothetical protein